MKREEKRQKFHEGLIRMLYPPPPSPPPQEENNVQPLDILEQGLNLDQIPDEVEEDNGSSSSGDQGSDHGPAKLTRAQRKRIRRKKLKQAASRRQDIIGPLFPTRENDGEGANASVTEEEPPQGVRHNVNESDDADSCSKQNKLKQRRLAKRVTGGSSRLTGDGDKA